MRALTTEEAAEFLAHYPKVRAALDEDGLGHAEQLIGRIPPYDHDRIRRGEITEAEDVAPVGIITLGELMALDKKLHDNHKFCAAAFVYAAAR